jgi:hypothetical protein
MDATQGQLPTKHIQQHQSSASTFSNIYLVVHAMYVSVSCCLRTICIVNDQGFQGGITEGQMLKFMGANIHLSPTQAKILLEVW